MKPSNEHLGTLATHQTNLLPPSRQVEELLAVGWTHLWQFQMLGKAPMLQEPVRFSDWLLVPAQQDSTPLPPRAWERIHAIFAAGARLQGFVLVHEAPLQLNPPPESIPRPKATTNFFGATASGSVVSDIVSAMGSVLSVLASTIIPAFLLAAAVMVDPILVAVTEDGYWIEIDRWNVEPQP